MHRRNLFFIISALLTMVSLLVACGNNEGTTKPATSTTQPLTTTTTQPPTTAAGAVIKGSIYYNGKLITDYTNSEAIISLVEVVSWQTIPAEYQYDNQTGSFQITGVPPGEYTPFIRIESGYPFDMESGGDFTARISGTNPNIVVSSGDDVINNDLAVIYHIHLVSPADNQEMLRSVNDEHENIYNPQTHPSYTFEWQPVPDATSYQITINLKNEATNQSQNIVNETITSTTYSVELDTTSEGQYYMFLVYGYNSSDELIGFFQYYYTDASGGWYNFIVVPD